MFQSSMHQTDEDFDQEPGEDEIHEYAIIIGIDPVKEPDLMWIARAGITAPLPPEWKPIQTSDNDLYFCNNKTGETSWEHPSDDKYRQMVLEERQSLSLKNQFGTKNVKKDNGLGSSAISLHKAPALPPTQTNTAKPSLGKLAPVSIHNSAPARGLGKLEPLNGSSKDPPPKFTPTAPKSTPISLNTPTAKSQADRPKTSRGANERANVPETPQPPKESRNSPSPQQIVGGGSRFLKKNEPPPQMIVKAEVLKVEPPKGKVMGKMDYKDSESEDDDEEDDDDETPSSVLSGPLDGDLGGDSHLFLDVDHLAPVAPPSKVETKPAKPVASNHANSAPQAKQNVPTSQPQVGKSQPVVSPAKPEPQTVPSTPKTDPKSTVPTPKNDPQPAKLASQPSKPVSKLVQQNQNLVEETKLKTDHENRLKEFKSKLTNDEETERKKLTEEMKERIKKFRNELEQNEVKEKNHMKFQHEKILSELKTKLQKEREQIEKEPDDNPSHNDKENVAKTLNSYKNELQELKRKFDDDKIRMQNEFETELTKIKQDFESKLHQETNKLEENKSEKLKTLKIRHDKEIAVEISKFERDKNNKTLQLKRDLDDIEKDIESEKSRLDSEKAALRSSEKKFMEEKTKEMHEQIEQEVAKRKNDLKQMHDREIADMQAEFEIHLTKLRRELKEKMSVEEQKLKQATTAAVVEQEKQKHNENIANDTEIHLKNLRQELNSLSELAKHLKMSIGDKLISSGDDSKPSAARHRAKTRGSDSKRKELIKSLDSFLSHEEESSSSTPVEQKLEMLESEDIVSKVQRFLASQDSGTNKKRQNNFDQKFVDDSVGVPRLSNGADFATSNHLIRPIGARSVGNRSNFSVRDALNTLQKDLQTLNYRVSTPNESNFVQNRNIFRLQPRDAVDELVDSKFRQYFSDAYSNLADRRNSTNVYVENRRTNVETELNSLKKWLEQFETDVASRKIMSDLDTFDDEVAEI